MSHPSTELSSTAGASLPIPPAHGIRSSLWKVFSFPAMLQAWIVLVVVRLAEKNLPDLDIWWHLRNAQVLFRDHRLPDFDTYSFTVSGHPWLNHEWLGEIPYYLAWRVFGLEGIEILMLLVLESIFLTILYLCYQRTKHIKASILACWFAVFLATVNFGPRPAIFGYACLAVLLVILERFHSLGRAPLWLAPPLFCLWINLHGSWCLGIAVFGIFIASGLVEGKWGIVQANRWSPGQQHRLVASFAGSCAALFVNPYGYRLVLYPLDLAVRQPLNIASIDEWTAVDFHTLRGKVVLALLGILFSSVLLGRLRWRLSDLLLVLFAFYSGLTYERCLFMAGMVTAPILTELLEPVPRYQPEIDKPWLNALILVGIAAFVIVRFPTPAQLETMVAQQYPAEVLPYFESHPPSGYLMNYYNWGGYLGWKDPRLKVFIDSRVDIFEYAGVFQDYMELLRFKDPLLILDEYHIRYVLFPTDAPLTYLLKRNQNWKETFSGRISTVMERTGPMPAGAVKSTAGSQNVRSW